MSKELDALEKIDHTVCLNLNNKTLKFGLDEYDNCDCKDFEEFDECCAVIEKALKEWEIWKDALETGEYECPEKKALEIIKEKDVDIIALRIATSLEQYNCKEDGRCPLTQEEYDLLKEVLL